MKVKYTRLNIDITDHMLTMIDEIGQRTGMITKKEIVNTALRYYREVLLKEKHLRQKN